MDAAIVTVGDELLTGDTENANATWLCRALTDRGVSVRRVLAVPDDRAVVADAVGEYAADFDAVLVTGGLGGTRDDLTMAAVADALDRPLAVDDRAREDVERTVERYRAENPEVIEEFPDLELDLDAQASIPAGARALLNPEGLSPGCVAENVYVLPGIPAEMRAVFGLVADEFEGSLTVETLYAPAPEGALAAHVDAVAEAFGVRVGSHPGRDEAPTRLTVAGTDADAVASAVAALRERVETVPQPDGE